MSKWVEIDPCSCFNQPSRPACYVVYLDGKLAYVGQTKSLKKRFAAYGIRNGYGGRYLTPWGAVRNVAIKCRYAERLGDQAMREIRLIHRLRPSLNCLGGPRRRAYKSKDNSRFSDAYYQIVNQEAAI